MNQKLWNPKAKKCENCPDLKKIQDKKTKFVDDQKKFCERFSWEIPNELAAKQALCKIDKPKKRRKK